MKNILFILHCPPPVHGSSIVGQSIKNSTHINNSFDCRYINIRPGRSVERKHRQEKPYSMNYKKL